MNIKKKENAKGLLQKQSNIQYMVYNISHNTLYIVVGCCFATTPYFAFFLNDGR